MKTSISANTKTFVSYTIHIDIESQLDEEILKGLFIALNTDKNYLFSIQARNTIKNILSLWEE